MRISKKWAVIAVIAMTMSPLWAANKKSADVPNAAMVEAMKLGSPSTDHKLLSPLTGTWTFTLKQWDAPNTAPIETNGLSDQNWAFGQRFLKQDFKCNFAGQPYEGVGYVGFDNLKSEYQLTWIDNMSTGIVELSGNFDTADQTFKFGGTFSCAITKEKTRWMRSEWKIFSNDLNTYVSYLKDANGAEFKAMEIIYKRVPKP